MHDLFIRVCVFNYYLVQINVFLIETFHQKTERDENRERDGQTDRERGMREEMLRGSFSAVSMTTAGPGCFVSLQLSDSNTKYINVFLPKHMHRQTVQVPCWVLSDVPHRTNHELLV